MSAFVSIPELFYTPFSQGSEKAWLIKGPPHPLLDFNWALCFHFHAPAALPGTSKLILHWIHVLRGVSLIIQTDKVQTVRKCLPTWHFCLGCVKVMKYKKKILQKNSINNLLYYSNVVFFHVPSNIMVGLNTMIYQRCNTSAKRLSSRNEPSETERW